MQCTIGARVAKELEEATGFECRATVVGYLQRGGTPSPYDRLLSTQIGAAAADFLAQEKFGNLVAVQNGKIKPVPLDYVAGKGGVKCTFLRKSLHMLHKIRNFAHDLQTYSIKITMTHNLLKGKRGIIFGALNEESIAWKVAVKAAEEGATIALSNTAMALRMGTLDKLAEQINAPIIAADATSVEDLEKVFTEAQEKLGGKIDFVLHSVAMSPNVRKHRTYDDLDYNFLNKTLDISAISFHKMLQVAKKLDAINEWGSVVALTYVASQRTFFGYNDMADAKSMLESIARSFGYIYGREKHVRINTISQSPTATTAGKGIKDIENMMDFADKMSPLGNAVAEDCANYCVMMFSDFTRKVTMQNLFHDGGFSSMGMSLRAMNQYAKDMTPYEDENGKVIYG